MRKIFWAIPDLEIGGAERMTVDLLPSFAEHGDAVTLFLVNRRGAFLDKIPPSIQVRSADAGSLRSAILPLARALHEEKPDLIFSNLTHLNLAVILLTRLMGLKSKVLVFEHSTLSLNNKSSLKELILLKFASWIYHFADHVFAVSEGARKDMIRTLKIPARKTSIVYNPVQIEEIRRAAKIRTGYDLIDLGKEKILVAVGRFERAKNFSFLLRAFAIVRAKIDARLVMVGNGSEFDNLRELAKALNLEQDVLFVGYHANPYAFVSRADVVACSSLYEGFNRTLAEALVLGKRVVSVDCPWGPAEILCDGKFGTLTAMGDEAAFAESLLFSLETDLPESERQRLMRRGEDFSVGRSFAALERAIQEVYEIR